MDFDFAIPKATVFLPGLTCDDPSRVPRERISLLELYDGPVAEVAILKSDASRSCKSLAQDLSNASRTKFLNLQGRASTYVRSISAVKIRGNPSSARPLSTMLRPLADSIQEHLTLVDLDDRTRRGEAKESEIHGSMDPSNASELKARHVRSMSADKFDTATSREHPEGLILEVSSESDVESLAYTASVFTIQVRHTFSPFFPVCQGECL